MTLGVEPSESVNKLHLVIFRETNGLTLEVEVWLNQRQKVPVSDKEFYDTV